MQKKWSACIIAGVVCALLLSGCGQAQPTPTPIPTPVPTPGGGSQIANPAATHCVEQGYTSQIRTAADGSQYGVCIFPDGSECEEWAFFRGECSPAAKPTPAATQQVSIPEIGLAFELPASWQRRGDDWAWIPAGDSTGRVGVTWGEAEAGKEPESILPDNAQMLGRTEGPQFAWGTAATYKLQVMVPGGQGQVQAVETHVLFRLGQLLCDFYASGATEEELLTMERTLQSLLASVSWTH